MSNRGPQPVTGHPHGELLAYALAIVVWAALGVVFKPALSMVLSPFWMVLCISVIPRLLRRSGS